VGSYQRGQKVRRPEQVARSLSNVGRERSERSLPLSLGKPKGPKPVKLIAAQEGKEKDTKPRSERKK
jgi:hypothetical protein